MPYSKISQLPIVEEEDATDEVSVIFAEIKQDMQLPVVPNIMKALAVSPNILAIYWNMTRTFYQNITLPESLVSMIMYSVAQSNNCQYCSAGHELTCRTLGVDEQTLIALTKDLEHVSPQRLRAIIEFAVKVSRNPQGLRAQDYDLVRQEGVTDEELVEIIFIAAISRLGDTLADSLKIEVDTLVAQALGR